MVSEGSVHIARFDLERPAAAENFSNQAAISGGPGQIDGFVDIGQCGRHITMLVSEPAQLRQGIGGDHIIGEVTGKTCVLIDDMVDTAGTLCRAAQALKDEGATKVIAYITHPVLSGDAVTRIVESALDELVVTDTIPLSEPAKRCGRIRQLSVAALLAETIRRIRDEESVSSLYVD